MIRRRVSVARKRKGKVASTRRKLNLLWSEIVRKSNGGSCWLSGWDGRECGGPIQAAHCFGKKAYPSVRFELWNGVPLCRNHHCFYTYRVESWGLILTKRWGLSVYEKRHRLAGEVRKQPLDQIMAELTTALREVA